MYSCYSCRGTTRAGGVDNKNKEAGAEAEGSRAVPLRHCTDLHEEAEHSSRDSNSGSSRSNGDGSNSRAVAAETQPKTAEEAEGAAADTRTARKQ